jgi:hypothetical protein
MKLLRRIEVGDPPMRPKAWFGKVAQNLWKSSKHIPRHGQHYLQMSLGSTHDLTIEYHAIQPPVGAALHGWLHDNQAILQAELSSRKRRVLEACLHSTTDSGAARRVGEAPANFRRARKELGRKIRALIADGRTPPPLFTAWPQAEADSYAKTMGCGRSPLLAGPTTKEGKKP